MAAGVLVMACLSAWASGAATPTTQAAGASAELKRLADDAVKGWKNQGQISPATQQKILEAACSAPAGADSAAIVQAACALRLASLGKAAQGLDPTQPAVRTMLLLSGQSKDPAGTARLLHKLTQTHPEAVQQYPQLAAAVALVHGKPLSRSLSYYIGASKTAFTVQLTAPDGLAVFDYYVANSKGMACDLRHTPAELLVNVVDVTSPVAELKWALGQYGRKPAVAARFYDIRYDPTTISRNMPVAGVSDYSLERPLRFGGVSLDQAYFASTVGKACGVPSVMVVPPGDANNGWVTFLDRDKSGAWWDMDTARYASFRGIRGQFVDGVTGAPASEGGLSVTSALLTANPDSLDLARAMVVLARLRGGTAGNLGETLSLLERAIELTPGCVDAWNQIAELAPGFSQAQRTQWDRIIGKTVIERYPEVAYDVLVPMIKGVADVRQRDAMWDKAAGLFRRRDDLAAEIRMQQAEMWRAAAQPKAAGRAYEDVINRYPNSGMVVTRAIAGAERILREADRSGDTLALYEHAFTRMAPPAPMPAGLVYSTAWYRVGMLYARKAEDTGDEAAGKAVRQQIAKALAEAERLSRGGR